MSIASTQPNGHSHVRRRWQDWLRQAGKHNWFSAPAVQTTPLLSIDELQQLHVLAISANSKPLHSRHEVNTLQVGERSSAFAGSGYEFAENQLYVRGDDSRFINWRLLAKTGKLYRKVFHEERRPQFWVIVDKRASMRFGTRVRLKVTQAARHALFHLYQAQQQKLACGGVILDERLEWFSPAQGISRLQPLVKSIISPAPPLFGENTPGSLHSCLKQLNNRIAAGSIIMIISDFSGLNKDCLATLHDLSTNHTVIARHIIDPAEIELTSSQPLYVAKDKKSEPVKLNCNDTQVKQQLNQLLHSQQQDIEKQLTSTGANYFCHHTDEPLGGETQK